MIRVMIAAAHADGVLDADEEKAILDRLRGAELTDEEKEDLDIKNGIKILTLNAGKLLSADAKEGFIILKI